MPGDEGQKDLIMDEERSGNRPDDLNQDEAQEEMVARLRTQLALLRDQVRRLHDALHKTENLRTSARERLHSLRTTSEKLEQALRMEEAAQEGRTQQTPAQDFPPADPPTWRPVAHGTRTLIEQEIIVQLSDRHVHALMVSGLLSLGEMEDGGKVSQVVQKLLDRWSDYYMEEKTGLPDGDTKQRRSGRDRRGRQPRANSLLSYVYQTTLDRRTPGDRRRAHSGSKIGTSQYDALSPIMEANVVSLENVRVLLRNRQRQTDDVVNDRATKRSGHRRGTEDIRSPRNSDSIAPPVPTDPVLNLGNDPNAKSKGTSRPNPGEDKNDT